jgi:predicted kinase
MPKPLLLVVTGRPATGKTSLARSLAADLRLPLIHKDGLKESLFDELGVSDRGESRRIGAASFRLQRVVAAELLQVGVSLVVESNFSERYDGAPLRALVYEHGARIAQIWLSAEPRALVERFERRAAAEERHPGHLELAHMDEFRQALLAPGDTPLSLPGPIFAMDTTDLNAMDHMGALAFARMELSGAMDAGGSS